MRPLRAERGVSAMRERTPAPGWSIRYMAADARPSQSKLWGRLVTNRLARWHRSNDVLDLGEKLFGRRMRLSAATRWAAKVFARLCACRLPPVRGCRSRSRGPAPPKLSAFWTNFGQVRRISKRLGRKHLI